VKILHCIPALVTGGAQRQLSYLAPALAGMGHEVHAAYLHGGPNLDRMEKGGVILHRIRSRGNHDPSIFLRLVDLMLRVRPDVVQSWLLQMDILAGSAARLLGIPWIISERSAGPPDPGTAKNRIRVRIAAGARAVVSNSAGGDAYWAKSAPGVRRHVVPNGLPLDELSRALPEPLAPLGIRDGEKVVLFVGRFEPGKNIEKLLVAFSIAARETAAKIILCGDGPRRDSIRAVIDREGISGSAILPGISTNVPGLLKRADVFAFPSGFEGFPNVVLEAMACGCPIVASDIPAHRDFLDERSALLVDPTDPRAIAAAIRASLADPDGARRRAGIAREKVARWTIPAMAESYARIYAEIAGAPKGGPAVKGEGA
jgi:glycosyltransferase involved in cell wall biosynthesis